MRRVIFYLVNDPRGQIDEYVVHQLRALRANAQHIFVVSGSTLQPDSRARVAEVADTVWERRDGGPDVRAHQDALDHFGADALSAFDELILMDDTFFGPIGSFAPIFAEMDADTTVDFWGVTDGPDGGVHEHWLAIRSSVFSSGTFETCWADESGLTDHFTAQGFVRRVAFPASDFPSEDPAMDNAAMLLRSGCPIVSRRPFVGDPLYLDRRAILGRELLGVVEASGYPVDLLLSHLSRTSVPRDLATNLGLLEILPDHDLGYDASRPLRIAAVAHIYYVDMTAELLDRFRMLPGDFDLVVTTTDDERRLAIEAILAQEGVTADVRIVESNRGRDISAFFIGCRDLIESDDYDLIVRFHSKRSPQDDHNLGELFKRHLLENLLGSPGHAANVVRLFQRYPSLGIVFPPVIHLGYPTMGHAWFANREPAETQASRLGIDVPFDQSTPLATYGSMFIARPAALRPILRGHYAYAEFPGDGEYQDGSLSHVLERLVAYGALSEGFHARQVLNVGFAAIYHSYLEFKLQSVAELLPSRTRKQVPYLRKLRKDSEQLRGMKTKQVASRSDRPARRAGLAARAVRRVARTLRRAWRRCNIHATGL